MVLTILYIDPEFQSELESEISFFGSKFIDKADSFYLVDKKYAWAQWSVSGEIVAFKSISEAAKILKERSRFWYPLRFNESGRQKLIAENIQILKERKLSFDQPNPYPEYGVFCLLDKNRLFVSQNYSPNIPLGVYTFAEDKFPPSRAYLKLWEALWRSGKMPQKGQKCLDLGSSPGSWSWVMANLGCEVTSIDRASLDPKLNGFKNIKFVEGDAFAQLPEKIGPLDWIVCDVICFPEPLLEFMKAWKQSGKCKNFVCTIKFKGKADPALPEKFLSLGGNVVHLSHNKHELCWIC